MTIWGGYTPMVGDITGKISSGSGLGVTSLEPRTESSSPADNSSGLGGVTTWSEGVVEPRTESSEPIEAVSSQPVFDPSKLDLGPVGGGSKVYVRDDGTVGPTPNETPKNTDTIKPITPTVTEKLEEAAKKMDNVYRPMGDDYDIDTDAAFAAAQAGTGDNQLASSISGSSSGGKGTQNSNTNDGIFGGQSNKANPGYSLW